MPRRYSRRRTYRRRRGGVNNITRFPGFPSNKLVMMRYSDTFSFDHNVSNVYNRLFAANSIFDPDMTGVGHQPLGHDQWAVFYNHYFVIGSKITIQVTGPADAASAPMVFCIILDDSGGSFTTIPQMIEQGGSHYVVSNGDMEQYKPARVRSSFSAKKFFNVTNVNDNYSRLGAAFGANPADLAYFQFTSATLDGLISLQTRLCIVTIEYLVLMSEPRTLPQS